MVINASVSRKRLKSIRARFFDCSPLGLVWHLDHRKLESALACGIQTKLVSPKSLDCQLQFAPVSYVVNSENYVQKACLALQGVLTIFIFKVMPETTGISRSYSQDPTHAQAALLLLQASLDAVAAHLIAPPEVLFATDVLPIVCRLWQVPQLFGKALLCLQNAAEIPQPEGQPVRVCWSCLLMYASYTAASQKSSNCLWRTDKVANHFGIVRWTDCWFSVWCFYLIRSASEELVFVLFCVFPKLPLS